MLFTTALLKTLTATSFETCEALNTTDEKAQNLLVRWPETLLKLVYCITEVVLFCGEMWGNPINIHISAIQNTELMF